MSYEAVEDKRIYRRAEEISDKIWHCATEWPDFARRSVGLQMVRSADSIGANIAEGMGRFHPADVCKFLYYARGSLRETIFWIRRASRRNLMPEALADELLNDLDELARELNKTIKFQRTRTT